MGVAGAEEPYAGQTLISLMNQSGSYLIDLDGTITRIWHGSATPASMAYLLDDGSILRPCKDPTGAFNGGGAGGRIQRIDADDTVIWDYYFSTSDHQQHHDIQPLPNGNLLLIAWEAKTAQEASNAGRQSASRPMWPTLIVEVEPVGASVGNIVWEWHAWDHLVQDVYPEKPNYGVVADHPELIDINYGSAIWGDWIHANAIDYNEQLDQIVFSSRQFNEFYVIDHSTTTEEAAGHTGGNSGMGGDILYRWGNPQVYGRGTAGDQYFSVVHGVNWIDAGLPGEGNILAFNNGDRPGYANDYSTVAEIVPPVGEYGNYSIEAGQAFGPSAPIWTYGGPGVFYGGPTQGGAYRMPNGNTIICSARDRHLFEVTGSGETVWEYYDPYGSVGRADRYWTGITGIVDTQTDAVETGRLTARPNPFSCFSVLSFTAPTESHVDIRVVDLSGREVSVLADADIPAGELVIEWDGLDEGGRKVAPGIYFAVVRTDRFETVRKLVLIR
jgi:hypothetical protein